MRLRVGSLATVKRGSMGVRSVISCRPKRGKSTNAKEACCEDECYTQNFDTRSWIFNVHCSILRSSMLRSHNSMLLAHS